MSSRRVVARIIIDSSSLRYLHTGLGQFSYHLLKQLAGRHLSAESLVAVAHPDCRHLVPAGIDWAPASWLRRHAPDWIQGHLYPSCAVWHMTSENSRLTGIPPGASLVLTIHGLHFLDEFTEQASADELRRIQHLVDRAAVIVTVSRFTADLVRAKLSVAGKTLEVIPNGIEQVPVEERKPAWAPDQRFLFSVGSFFHRKNFHVLIPMMKHLPEFRLILAGDYRHAYGEDVRKVIKQEGLEDRVLLPGDISEGEKQWLFSQGEAFLFPSLSEGFGIPILEAFHRGKPVFCSRAGSLPEVGGDHAIYWDNFTPEHMAQRVKTGLAEDNPEFSMARKLYAARFTWASVAEDYLKIYRSLLPAV